MAQHHYLGSLPKISETLWYVACWHDQWVALLSFSASALKCAVRDSWIGWGMHNRYDRLKLIVNNSRFLILPDRHRPNLGSRVLSLCSRRLNADWQETFGHSVVLLETFVDSQRFSGNGLQGGQLDLCGGYQRVSPDSQRLQRIGGNAQEGFFDAPAGGCRRFFMSASPSILVSDRRFKDDAYRATNGIAAVIFFRDNRSSSIPRSQASAVNRPGDCHCRLPVRHAGIPGNIRLGPKSRHSGQETFWLPL